MVTSNLDLRVRQTGYDLISTPDEPPAPPPLLSLSIIACLLTLALVSCVRTYRVADVHARVDEVVGKIDTATRQTKADVREMRRICEPLLATRPRLRQILKRIDA